MCCEVCTKTPALSLTEWARSPRAKIFQSTVLQEQQMANLRTSVFGYGTHVHGSETRTLRPGTHSFGCSESQDTLHSTAFFTVDHCFKRRVYVISLSLSIADDYKSIWLQSILFLFALWIMKCKRKCCLTCVTVYEVFFDFFPPSKVSTPKIVEEKALRTRFGVDLGLLKDYGLLKATAMLCTREA